MAQVFAHLGGGLVELRWEFAAVTTPRAQINHKDVVVNAHGCNMGVREIPVRHSTKLKTADRVYHGWSASISKLMADFTPKKQNPQKVHWQNQNRSINRPFFPILFQKKKSTGVDNKSNDDLAHCHYDSWEILNKTEPLLMLSINAFFYHDNPHHPTARTDTLAHLGTAVQKHLVKTGNYLHVCGVFPYQIYRLIMFFCLFYFLRLNWPLMEQETFELHRKMSISLIFSDSRFLNMMFL